MLQSIILPKMAVNYHGILTLVKVGLKLPRKMYCGIILYHLHLNIKTQATNGWSDIIDQ